MNITEIKIEKFPLVIITDTHCHVKKINEVKTQYPHAQIICLGDITDLFNEKDAFNKHSINYFIENEIPCLEGNHEAFIKACYTGDSFVLSNVLINTRNAPTYRIDEKIHIAYLNTLPRGFKLLLPDGHNYYCFHNRPKDLWSFTDREDLTVADQFLNTYPHDEKTVGIIHGHGHKPFVKEHEGTPILRYSVGALKYGDYAVLTETGLNFKKL